MGVIVEEKQSSASARAAVFEREGYGLLWVAGALLFAIACGIAFYHIPVGSSGFFAYVGHTIVEGKTIYHDVWDNKLPSIYYVHALWQLLFGSQYVLYWAAQVGVLLVSIVLFAIFARDEGLPHWGPATVAFSVLLALVPLQHFGYTEPYAVVLMLAALVAVQRGAAILGGVFLCLAATFWIPSCLTAIAVLVYLRTAALRVRFLAGFAVSAALYGALIVWAFTPPVIAGLLHDMRSYQALKTHLDLATLRDVAYRLMTTLDDTGLTVPFVLAIGLIRKPASRTQRFALVWLLCTLAGAAINVNVFQHYFIPSVAPLVFFIFAYAQWPQLSRVRRVVLAVLVAGLLIRTPHIVGEMRDAAAGDVEETRLTLAIGKILDAAVPIGGTILVDGTIDGVYLASGRDASGRFANTFGLALTSPEQQRARRREYLRDVRRSDAVVVSASRISPFTELDEVLRTEFRPLCPGAIPGVEIHLNRRVGVLHQPPC